MKKLLTLAFLTMLMCSCANDTTVVEPATSETDEMTLSCKLEGDFTFESFTRAASATVGDVWIFDFMDGKYLQMVHQQAGDANFGIPNITLKYGTHELYFVVSSGSVPSLDLNNNTIMWNRVGDTFWISATAVITPSTSPNLSVSLNRVVTMLKLKSKDVAPDDVIYVRIVPRTWYYGLSYKTGKPTAMTTNKTVQYNIENTGECGEFHLYGFATDDEYRTDVNFMACTENHVTIQYNTMESVPFIVNRVTSMTGWIFSETATGLYNYNLWTNVAWAEEYNGTW